MFSSKENKSRSDKSVEWKLLFNFEGTDISLKGGWYLEKGYMKEPESLRLWGCSSAGRAPALQAGGQEFDPPHLHQGRGKR